MRKKTRCYTWELPTIDLRFLAKLQKRQMNSDPAAKVWTDTESGRLFLSQVPGGYKAVINGTERRMGITTTRAGYGRRTWYVCPHCRSRCAKLYIGRKDIGCRTCWSLSYASQSADHAGRMFRRAYRLRRDIWGDNPSMLDNLLSDPRRFPKPARMRWATYEKKLQRLVEFEGAFWRALNPRLMKGFHRLMKKAAAAGLDVPGGSTHFLTV